MVLNSFVSYSALLRNTLQGEEIIALIVNLLVYVFSIVFMDEIDAVGTKRYDSNSGGEREIQRTMLELLNQLDGFDSRGDVKVMFELFRELMKGTVSKLNFRLSWPRTELIPSILLSFVPVVLIVRLSSLFQMRRPSAESLLFIPIV